MRQFIVALSVGLLLSACENSMRTDVTQFSALNSLPAGRSIAVYAEPAQSGSLEFNYYAGLVGAALQDHGFKSTAPETASDLVVVIHYGSAGNHTELYGGPWGPGWGWRGRGAWNRDLDSKTYYAETLEVQIFDGAAWRNNVHTMLYQGRVVGDATVNDISTAMPGLVKALFSHFPGNNGGTERVVVPMPDDKATTPPAVRAQLSDGLKTTG